MVMAANVIRRPINVWRVTPAGKAELIVTYGEEIKATGIHLLWHEAGHYGETCLKPEHHASHTSSHLQTFCY